MKRFLAITAFALAASFAGADPRPFQLGVGVGPGYLGLTNDVESNFNAALRDQRASYSFWGGSTFIDISDYFTLSTGVWSGLGKANGSIDPGHTRTTPDNTLILLDVSTVVKGPVTVGPLTLSPKIGFSDVLYLAGQLGGATPDANTKASLSPFSFLVGADADYVFPNGIFLRLPVDVTIALNSRPKSSAYQGSYVASSGFGFSTGLLIGYKMLGHENDSRPAPAASTATAETTTGAPAQAADDQAPAKKPQFAVGGGLSGLALLKDQNSSAAGVTLVQGEELNNIGLNAFVDLTEYFTAFFGVQFGVGKSSETYTGYSSSNWNNQLFYWELGAEVKYPIALGDTASFAPKLGFTDLIYAGGKLNGSTIAGSSKQFYSPLSVTVGADFNLDLGNNLFARVPLDLGMALNAQQPKSFYGSGTYKSSFTLSFRSAAEVGYRL